MKLVSKVYILGSSEESPDAVKVNASIANARLKMDYQRLKDAKITFEEKYFQRRPSDLQRCVLISELFSVNAKVLSHKPSLSYPFFLSLSNWIQHQTEKNGPNISLDNAGSRLYDYVMKNEEIRRFCKENGIELFVLFGSHATIGKTHPASDIDVAVKFRRG